jgi:hypothetical protein
MLTQEETRRRVSIDFTLSAQQRTLLRPRHGLTVPISVPSWAASLRAPATASPTSVRRRRRQPSGALCSPRDPASSSDAATPGYPLFSGDDAPRLVGGPR